MMRAGARLALDTRSWHGRGRGEPPPGRAAEAPIIQSCWPWPPASRHCLALADSLDEDLAAALGHDGNAETDEHLAQHDEAILSAGLSEPPLPSESEPRDKKPAQRPPSHGPPGIGHHARLQLRRSRPSAGENARPGIASDQFYSHQAPTILTRAVDASPPRQIRHS